MGTKPFKETKVGRFLLGAADTMLPDSGILGVFKELIDSDDSLTPEEKKQATERLYKLKELEVADRQSARTREVGVRKYGFDFLFNLTGIVGLGSFIFAIYAIVYEPSTRGNDLFVHLLGLLEGVVVSNLFAYYFGTSTNEKK